ncbi:MAG: hypothetical protein EHM33_27410 [Chloroflexi bacterium]|nr:MAG: hypothetical protein EHM33_27410 [Chloroflexota bacterium]
MNDSVTVYLLTIRGTLAPDTLEVARKIHNQTAGDPAGVAAAQSLGDVSHMVYIPMPHDGHAKTKGAGEFLIMDLWTSIDGLNTFFSDHQVQEGGALIFSERDPVVWAPAEGFVNFHIPAPFGKNDRIIAVVRGTVKSKEEAKKLHDIAMTKTIGKARKLGMLSHEAYFRMAAPGSPEALEFFAVDVWMSGEGMGDYYGDEDFLAGFNHLFTAEAADSVWVHPKGDWIEW